MNSDDVRDILRRSMPGSVYAWAKANRISISYVHDFLKHRKEPGVSILNALDLEKCVEYRHKQPKKETIK